MNISSSTPDVHVEGQRVINASIDPYILHEVSVTYSVDVNGQSFTAAFQTGHTFHDNDPSQPSNKLTLSTEAGTDKVLVDISEGMDFDELKEEYPGFPVTSQEELDAVKAELDSITPESYKKFISPSLDFETFKNAVLNSTFEAKPNHAVETVKVDEDRLLLNETMNSNAVPFRTYVTIGDAFSVKITDLITANIEVEQDVLAVVETSDKGDTLIPSANGMEVQADYSRVTFEVKESKDSDQVSVFGLDTADFVSDSFIHDFNEFMIKHGQQIAGYESRLGAAAPKEATANHSRNLEALKSDAVEKINSMLVTESQKDSGVSM